jgi:hypothetical protein
MPIAFDIWRLDEPAHRLSPVRMDAEAKLESLLAHDVSFLGLDLLIISRQVITTFGKRIDLLALDAQGKLFVIELKRDRTPREIVAQALDYGSWVGTLTYEDITRIFAVSHPDEPFEEAFANRFGASAPEALNESHQLIIVATELDNSTERIVGYLSDYGVPVNALFFRYFRDGEREYLARTWLIDPNTTDQVTSKPPVSERSREPWTGEFYVALGEDEQRTWADCVKYGFISAGGGRWYSRTLSLLTPGAPIFACIPGTGYVGVGTVTEGVQPVREFIVEVNGIERPILEAPVQAPKMGENADNDELCEYLVRVEWKKALPVREAIWEKGMYANQNTVTKLRNKFTLTRLAERFGLTETDA